MTDSREPVLRSGLLKIAEVTSRFTSVDEFVKLVSALGFSLKQKVRRALLIPFLCGTDSRGSRFTQDESNTHFLLLDFVKRAGSDAREDPHQVDEHTRKASTLLNPCIYKRR